MAESVINQIKFSDADVANSDDFIPAGQYNPHNVHPFLLHDHGIVIAVVFASCLQDALDEAVDENKMDRFQLDPTKPDVQDDYMHEAKEGEGMRVERDGKVAWLDWNDDVAFLGNASEPFDIESLGVEELPNAAFSFCAMFNESQKDATA